MSKILLLLSALLLAGCTEDFATDQINGQDHALTIRRTQRYFWQDKAEVSLLAARLPDCQRLHALTTVEPADRLKVELFASDEQVWNIRVGQQLWQIETTTCNGLTELEYDPRADLGQAAGSFSVRDGKLVFEPVSPAHAASRDEVIYETKVGP